MKTKIDRSKLIVIMYICITIKFKLKNTFVCKCFVELYY